MKKKSFHIKLMNNGCFVSSLFFDRVVFDSSLTTQVYFYKNDYDMVASLRTSLFKHRLIFIEYDEIMKENVYEIEIFPIGK